MPTFVTTVTVVNQNQLPQSLENSLIDSEVGSLVNQNQLLQSLKDSLRDTLEESFGDNSLPETPTEMESVQLMNQLLPQLTIISLAEIHPSPFAGAAAENVLDWLESFKENATHNLWDDQEKLQVIPVYLNNTNLNFYCFLPEEIKGNIELLEAAL